MIEKNATLAIFGLTYLGIAAGRVPGLKLDRTGIAVLGAIAMLVFSGLPSPDLVAFIHWPTLLLLFGFFVLSAQLRLSGFFDAVAAAVAGRAGRPARFLFQLMLVTAGLSAVLNNDIVCFVFAPIVAAVLPRRGINPVPFLVAIAISSDLGAAATMIGNPQNMMIAQVAGLSFVRYALWCLAPVAFALACAYAIIWRLSRDRLALPAPATPPPVDASAAAPVPLDRAHTIKGLVILSAVFALFLTRLPKELVALTAAGIHLASPKYRTEDLLRLVDWPVLVLFMALFVVTGAFQATGGGGQIVAWLAHAGVNLQAPVPLALAAATLSNLINNAAAVMLLIKVAPVAQPPLAYVLALANSFGGALLLVGSVANLIVIQRARGQGIDISFRDFARLGVPCALAALAGLVAWVSLVA